MNTIVISGYIARDAEVKQVGKDLFVTNFTVAVKRSYKAKDGKDIVDFIPVYGFKKEKLAKYLVKGQQVVVQGELHLDQYEKNGEKRTYAKVNAQEIQLLGKAPGAPQKTPPNFEEIDEDLPF